MAIIVLRKISLLNFQPQNSRLNQWRILGFLTGALAIARTYRTKRTRSLSLLLVQLTRCGLVVAGYRGVEPPASFGSKLAIFMSFCVHLDFSVGDRGATYRGRTSSESTHRNCPKTLPPPSQQVMPLQPKRALLRRWSSPHHFAHATEESL